MSLFDEEEVKRLCHVYNKEHPREKPIVCSEDMVEVWGELQQ